MTEQVRTLVMPLLDERDVELYDVEMAGGVLRILVDRAGGIDLETISALSRLVSGVLDDLGTDGADPLPDRYTLEVSSPGLERPLRTERHFAEALGASVHVKTLPHVEGERRAEGVLLEADDEGITIAVAGTAVGDEPRRLRYDEIEAARTAFSWGASPKPGAASRGRTGTKKAGGAKVAKAPEKATTTQRRQGNRA